MPQRISTAQWGTALLKTLGNLQPSVQLQAFMTAWGHAEGGGGQFVSDSTNSCDGNVLNTKQKMAGSWNCTSGGIQAYRSNNDGLLANAMVLRGGGYPHLVQALSTNDAASLGFGGHTMTSGIIGDLSYWLSGDRAARPDYAASIAAAAGAQAGKGNGGQQNVASNQPSSSNSSQGGGILGFITGPMLAWIQNPLRLIKMAVGLLCIGASIFLLMTPEATQTVAKVAPFLA
jgi:hypothetical protein